MDSVKTRLSQRTKKISKNLKFVDQETRDLVFQERINQLESDYYDSPNRMAEDQSSEEFDLQSNSSNQKTDPKLKKRKKGKKKVFKKFKREFFIKKNVNLQKMIKEEGLEEPSKYPNFVNIKSALTTNLYNKHKFCSICTFSKYTCPRCGEFYCSLKCHNVHKEVACLKFDM